MVAAVRRSANHPRPTYAPLKRAFAPIESDLLPPGGKRGGLTSVRATIIILPMQASQLCHLFAWHQSGQLLLGL